MNKTVARILSAYLEKSAEKNVNAEKVFIGAQPLPETLKALKKEKR